MEEDDLEIIDEQDQFKDKLRKAKEELKKCRQEKDEYLTGWQRAKADYINNKKGEERRISERVDLKMAEILRDIISVCDGFDAALSLMPDKNGNSWSEGMQGIYLKLKALLASHNVEEIEAEGVSFDPREHEAYQTVQVDKKKLDGKVVKVIQKGYRYKHNLLRPSKVIVGRHLKNK